MVNFRQIYSIRFRVFCSTEYIFSDFGIVIVLVFRDAEERKRTCDCFYCYVHVCLTSFLKTQAFTEYEYNVALPAVAQLLCCIDFVIKLIIPLDFLLGYFISDAGSFIDWIEIIKVLC